MAVEELHHTIIGSASNLDSAVFSTRVHTSKGETLFQSTPIVKDNSNESSDSDR